MRIVNESGRRIAGIFSADVFRRMTKGRYTSVLRATLSEIVCTARLKGRVEILFGDSVSAVEEREDWAFRFASK
ncbi:MAG: hypothetical protein R3C60_13100 [Parvularculaceae bacterium]